MKQIGDHIWQISAKAEGPHLMIIGGTHGNERTGVEVVRALVDKGLSLEAGTLTLALGNLKAIEINERCSEPHVDLNRSYAEDLLEREPKGSYEDQRARELAPHIAAADYVIDIHATNKPSEAFICSLFAPEHLRLHDFFPVSKVLGDPEYILGGAPVTTDEYADAFGGAGICYETGQAGDTSRVQEVLEEMLGVMKGLGLTGDGGVSSPVGGKEYYTLSHRILLTEAGFTWESGYGNGSWEAFTTGQVIGHHGDEPLTAEYDGVVVFPKIDKHWQLGSSVGYLAKRIEIDTN